MMTVELHLGDCLDVMAGMPENSVDSVITDPPYGIFFMSANWDHGIPGVRFWEEALRVAKPGAMLMAFGGTRTHHRLMVAIEDAGWILRDTVMWVHGQGFPKSHDISRAIDKAAGAEREVVGSYRVGGTAAKGKHKGRAAADADCGSAAGCFKDLDVTAPATDLARTWDGWGTALKPAWEPVILAMAPLDGTFAQNAEKWGVAGLWIDGGRVEANGDHPGIHKSFSNELHEGYRRPWRDGSPPEYKPTPSGRFPANLIHDGSDEVVGLFPVTGISSGGRTIKRSGGNYVGGRGDNVKNWSNDDPGYGDSGSAARFFYCAKSSRKERTCNGTVECGHPTVKPLALMEYLCKLTRTPTGGIVLDPFMGSGTTGIACVKTGRDFIGIEIDPDYFEIAEARIAAAKAEPVQAEMPMGGGN